MMYFLVLAKEHTYQPSWTFSNDVMHSSASRSHTCNRSGFVTSWRVSLHLRTYPYHVVFPTAVNAVAANAKRDHALFVALQRSHDAEHLPEVPNLDRAVIAACVQIIAAERHAPHRALKESKEASNAAADAGDYQPVTMCPTNVPIQRKLCCTVRAERRTSLLQLPADNSQSAQHSKYEEVTPKKAPSVRIVIFTCRFGVFGVIGVIRTVVNFAHKCICHLQ